MTNVASIGYFSTGQGSNGTAKWNRETYWISNEGYIVAAAASEQRSLSYGKRQWRAFFRFSLLARARSLDSRISWVPLLSLLVLSRVFRLLVCDHCFCLATLDEHQRENDDGKNHFLWHSRLDCPYSSEKKHSPNPPSGFRGPASYEKSG